MADSYEILSSQVPQEHSYDMKLKSHVRIADTNAGSYPSSQINFTCSDVTADSEFVSTPQTNLEFNYKASVISSENLAEGAKQAAFFVALKKSYCDLYNGMSCKFNETNIISFSDLSNCEVDFKILSTFSQDDLVTKAKTINWSKNNIDSYTYQGASGLNGIGECSNTLSVATENFTADLPVQQNKGLVERMKQTGFSVRSRENALYTDQSKIDASSRSNMVYTSEKVWTYNILAILPLRYLHDLFAKLPLIRNPYFVFTFQIHSGTTTIDIDATGLKMTATANNQFDYNPIMVSKLKDAVTPETTKETSITIKYNIDKSKKAYLDFCTYKFTEEGEERYLNKMGKSTPVSFLDTYTIAKEFPDNSPIRFLCHQGLSKVRSFLLITQANNNAQATPSSTQNSTISVNNSPFVAGQNLRGISYTNMNLMINGKPHYQDGNREFTYQMYQNELISAKSINGGLTNGLSSGLISEEDFLSGIYNFVYIDLSRKEQSDDDVVKSIQFNATNNGLCKNLLLRAFINFEQTINVNVDTGQLVM